MKRRPFEWKFLNPEASVGCPLRSGTAGLPLLRRHGWITCNACREEYMREKLKDGCILFANRLPCWAAAASPKGREELCRQQLSGVIESTLPKEQQAVEVVEKTAKKEAGAAKPPVKQKASREEKKRDVVVPDALAINRYKKDFNLSKAEAVKKLVQEKREKAKQLKEPSVPKEPQTARNEMPWVPLPSVFPHIHSTIDSREDHMRYVSIAINLIRDDAQFRFEHNKQELQSMDEQLKSEREEFQKLTRRALVRRKDPIFSFGRFLTDMNRYILSRLDLRRFIVKGRYGMRRKIPVDDIETTEMALPTVRRVLNAGSVVRLALPDERRRFAFSKNVHEVRARFPLNEMNKQPIEKDAVVTHLALKYGVCVAMGASSAIAFVSKPWRDTFSSCLMHVHVKSVYSQHTGRMEKVCVVGKPCAEGGVNQPAIYRRYVKLAIKNAIVPETKSSEKTGGRQRAKQRKLESSTRRKSGLETSRDAAAASTSGASFNDATDETGALVIADGEGSDDDANLAAAARVPSTSSAPPEPTTACDDLLGNIFGEMDTSASSDNFQGGVESRAELSALEGGDLRKRYSVFSLGNTGVKDVEVLIRSNNDGVDSNGNTLAVVFKVEYAPEYGAERLSEEEWIRDFFKCRFKDASRLFRFRVHYSQLFFLQKERFNSRNLTADNAEVFKLAKRRAQLLKSAVLQLEELQPGSYMIRVNGDGSIEVMSELNDLMASAVEVNMDDEQTGVFKSAELPSASNTFQGIDEHVVLQYHMIQKRIPAAFHPARDDSWRGRGNSTEDVERKKRNFSGWRKRKRAASNATREDVEYEDFDAAPSGPSTQPMK